jgi:hypothetical protein
MSLLLAHNGHRDRARRCPLLGAKRTLIGQALISAYDPSDMGRRHKPIKDVSVARRDPSSKLKLGRTPINFQSIFGGKPGFEDIEL